jgi:transcriptional regulator with XRE-family HTH domain
LQQAGLSQDDLARHLGVSKSFVSKLLNGKKAWPEGLQEQATAFIAVNAQSGGQEGSSSADTRQG